MDDDGDATPYVDHTPFVAGGDAQEAHAEATPRSRSPSESPDVVGEEEMEDMRSRALAIKESAMTGDVESELVDMVLRLTSTGIPLKSQVMEQASTIANLSLQREFILERTEEEKGRWDAERESWSRTAEAVVTQANKPTPTIYKDPTKPTPFLESYNTLLRSKLADAQQRLTELETELAHLRPVLLMKPFALAHSSTTTAKQSRKKQRKDDVPVAGPSTSNADAISPEETTPIADSSQRPYYRPSQPQVTFLPPIVPKPKGTSIGKRGPTHADARSEHLLLAARKIGRERATMLSSAAFKSEDLAPSAFITSPSAKGKGRADEPHAHAMHGNPYTIHYPTTPKTPQKGSPIRLAAFGSPGTGLHYPPPGQPILLHSPPVPRIPGGPHPPPFAYVPGPIPGPAYAIYGPAYGYAHMHAPAGSPTRSSGAQGSAAAAAQSRWTTVSPPKTAKDAPAPRTKRAVGKRKTQVQVPEPPVASSSKGTAAGATHAPAPTASPISAFDLLHSAAQSVLSPAADVDSTAKRQKRAAVDDDDRNVEASPTPTKKRARTLAEAADADARGGRGIGRLSSALDVLADQAMFIGSQSTRSKASSIFSHSRSGSEHSIGVNEPDSAISPTSTSGSPTLLPARWNGPSRASASRSMGPPKAIDRRFDTIAPKSKPVRTSTANGQTSSRRTRSHATAQNHDRVERASISASDAEDVNERRASAGEASTSSTATALPTHRAAQLTSSSSLQNGHEELRKEWLKKLGRFT